MKSSELFIDIETIPAIDDRVRKEIEASITPPGNMKKAETIATWEANEKPALVDEAIKKTSLDGTYGRVCCVSFAFGDGQVHTLLDRDEKKILVPLHKEISEYSRSNNGSSLVTIGHYVRQFDMRFLWQRSIINGVSPSKAVLWDGSPYSDLIRDTMTMWNPDKDKRISLHKLCLALGVESPKDKNGMDGGDIALLWAKRDYNKIIAYSVDDVESMRQCYRRMTI